MPYSYVGSELEVFSRAVKWKAYYGKHLRPYLGRSVLEVGAGIGGTTLALCGGGHDRWVCLEPDPEMAAQITAQLEAGRLPPFCEVVAGTLADVEDRFDSVIYIDVLEHIEDDALQLREAAERLKPGGFLVVLSPAHQAFYTPFDRAIGHYRRYNRRGLESIAPPSLRPVRIFYLDSVGALASLGNKFLLKSAHPTHQQIAFWDKVMIPLSKLFDPLLGYRLGKTIVGVWRR